MKLPLGMPLTPTKALTNKYMPVYVYPGDEIFSNSTLNSLQEAGKVTTK